MELSSLSKMSISVLLDLLGAQMDAKQNGDL